MSLSNLGSQCRQFSASLCTQVEHKTVVGILQKASNNEILTKKCIISDIPLVDGLV
jgi:hypothetical protein